MRLMTNADGRVVVWFSCGAASACAAKLAVAKYPGALIVYCDTLVNEHTDNLRFLQDVERWTGKTVKRIASPKYKSVDEVIQITKYMSGPRGARCTLELKKLPRYDFQLPCDLHVFGLTADEGKRITRFEAQNTDLEMEWILRDAGLTHADCLDMLRAAGIEIPVMYRLGFNNNNCIGCLKAGGIAYWARVRRYFPDVFHKRCQQSRALGARLLMLSDHRVFLDELPSEEEIARLFPGVELPDDTEQVECGVFCVSEVKHDDQ
jgi:hypothetical protein